MKVLIVSRKKGIILPESFAYRILRSRNFVRPPPKMDKPSREGGEREDKKQKHCAALKK